MTTQVLPRWDMEVVFPSLESQEFRTERDALLAEIDVLKAQYDELGINEGGKPTAAALAKVIDRSNEFQLRLRTLGGFISSFVTTDAKNELAQSEMSSLSMRAAELANLSARFKAWIRGADIDALASENATIEEHRFALAKTKREASRLLTPAEEELLSVISPSAMSSWSKLYGNVTSLLMVDVLLPSGDAKTLPMSSVRGLAADPDRDVREAAYNAEIETWERNEVVIAQAMNSIKGTAGVLGKRRGYADVLEPSIESNNIDSSILDAMQSAVIASFPEFRRYLRAKAGLVGGDDACSWFDIFAPVGESAKRWTFDEAAEFIVEKFATYSPEMSHLARRSFDERWIDAEPREGKRDSAFCMSLRNDESRILANFSGSFGAVSTLAHELGHAYHNVQLARRTRINSSTPMALAETASIFCQTIIGNALLAEASSEDRLSILDAELQSSCQVVVDIHSRFLFEKSLHHARVTRELSAKEMCDLMTKAQRETYGDGLQPDKLHPYMWAAKPHYYGSNFYNWPYTFGLLFGLGLYSRYLKDEGAFKAGYDELLSSTGMANAADLGKKFGIDFASEDFWTASLDVLKGQIDEFVTLAGG